MSTALEKYPAPAQVFWADLTGASERWGRTLLLAVVIGRLSMTALGLMVLLAAGKQSTEGFTGVLQTLDTATIFGAVIGAPLIESLIVLALVWLIGFKLRASAAVTAVLVGLAFIPQHGLALVSVMTAPFFALEALILFNWMRRGSGVGGFWLVFFIHAISNGLSVLAVATFGPALL